MANRRLTEVTKDKEFMEKENFVGVKDKNIL